MAAKKLGLEPVIDASARVTRSELGAYTEIGARTLFTESALGDYSYVVQDCEIIYSNADQDASKQQQQAEAAITKGAASEKPRLAPCTCR